MCYNLQQFLLKELRNNFTTRASRLAFINKLQRLNPLKFVVAQARESAQLEGLQCYL